MNHSYIKTKFIEPPQIKPRVPTSAVAHCGKMTSYICKRKKGKTIHITQKHQTEMNSKIYSIHGIKRYSLYLAPSSLVVNTPSD